MGSVLIIIGLVVVVIGVPALVARRPWKRETGSVSSHGATMAVLAALAERSRGGIPEAAPLSHGSGDLPLAAPPTPTPPSTVRTVRTVRGEAGSDPDSAEDPGRAAIAPVPPEVPGVLPVIETIPGANDTGILWIGPVSEPPPPEAMLSAKPAIPDPSGPSWIPPPTWRSRIPARPRPSPTSPPAHRSRAAGPTPGWTPRTPRRVDMALRSRAGASAAVALLAVAVAGAATALVLTDRGTSHRRPVANARPGSTKGRTRPATAPSSTTVVPISTTPGGATYSAPSSSFTLQVAASGPCWVEAKPSASSSQIAFEGLLAAGASHTFSASGSIWLRVGYATHIQVSLDGTRVQLPLVGPSPFDLTFASTTA